MALPTCGGVKERNADASTDPAAHQPSDYQRSRHSADRALHRSPALSPAPPPRSPCHRPPRTVVKRHAKQPSIATVQWRHRTAATTAISPQLPDRWRSCSAPRAALQRRASLRPTAKISHDSTATEQGRRRRADVESDSPLLIIGIETQNSQQNVPTPDVSIKGNNSPLTWGFKFRKHNSHSLTEIFVVCLNFKHFA